LSGTAEATAPNGETLAGPSPYLEAAAVGVRVAGMVVALAYLTGALPGPLLAPAGALALVTFGHALLLERTPSLVAGAAFAVIIAALTAGALRWATIDLGELRGVQAVLGPTVLVEKSSSGIPPALAPIAAWGAAAACVFAMAVWLRFPRGEVWFSLLPWAAELLVAGLAVATVFWGPSVDSLGAGDAGAVWQDVGGWAVVTLAVAVPAGAISYLLARVGRVWTFAALAVAAASAFSALGIFVAVVQV
jgi:hypothetical protein